MQNESFDNESFVVKVGLGYNSNLVKRVDSNYMMDNKGKTEKRKVILLITLCFFAVLVIGILIFLKCNITPPSQGSDDSGLSNNSDGISTNDAGSALAISGADRKNQFYTFLLCGTDEVNSNTDTIMVMAFDAVNNKLYVVSIPRDTMINVSWSVKKINASYPVGGVDELKKQVTKLLGFEVDNYAVVNLIAFQQVVDAIGGVNFNVPQDMDYDDPVQDLHIHVKAGLQHLDGVTALGVCRFRHGYAMQDLGRINTQQLFLKAVAQQMLQVQNVTKINAIAKIMSENLKTNLSYGNMVWLGLKFKGLSSDNIQFATLSGGTETYQGVSYSYVNVDDLIKTMNETVNPYKTDISIKNLDILTIVNGEPKATTGTIAGGINSFLNTKSSTKSEQEVVTEIPKETSTASSVSPKTSVSSTVTPDNPSSASSTDISNDTITSNGTTSGATTNQTPTTGSATTNASSNESAPIDATTKISQSENSLAVSP